MSNEFQTCDMCGAWEIKAINDTQGECRRHAPAVVDGNWNAVWPVTKNTEGCYDAVPQRPLGDNF